MTHNKKIYVQIPLKFLYISYKDNDRFQSNVSGEIQEMSLASLIRQNIQEKKNA